MEWYHVWWPWLTCKRVARFVSDSCLSAIAEFLLLAHAVATKPLSHTSEDLITNDNLIWVALLMPTAPASFVTFTFWRTQNRFLPPHTTFILPREEQQAPRAVFCTGGGGKIWRYATDICNLKACYNLLRIPKFGEIFETIAGADFTRTGCELESGGESSRLM